MCTHRAGKPIISSSGACDLLYLNLSSWGLGICILRKSAKWFWCPPSWQGSVYSCLNLEFWWPTPHVPGADSLPTWTFANPLPWLDRAWTPNPKLCITLQLWSSHPDSFLSSPWPPVSGWLCGLICPCQDSCLPFPLPHYPTTTHTPTSWYLAPLRLDHPDLPVPQVL